MTGRRRGEAFEWARRDAVATGADLRALASCEWLLGRQEACLAHLESAFRMLSEDGCDMGAAEAAMVLSLVLLTRGRLTLGRAWNRRARRILADLPEGRGHAYDVYVAASMDLDDTGVLWPAESVSRMRELAATLRQPAVSALSAVVAGMAAIRAGRAAVADDGIVVIMDEATEEHFTADASELERLLYGFSLFVCLPDGLSHRPSAGTGTVMRPSTLRGYARSAGWSDIRVLIPEFGLWRFYEIV